MSRVIKPDFQSLTYYFTTVIGAGEDGKNAMSVGHPNPYVPATEWGWSIDPYGYYSMLMEYWHRYQLPILILENGLGHRDELAADGHVHDQNRIAYLRAHIERMGQAIDDGVQMEGYCTWSATDLYSTRNGFGKRYGFVYVDQDHDFRRIRKDSFFWYKKVIATNGADLSD
jgi:6-phospho-beta-glucosidase